MRSIGMRGLALTAMAFAMTAAMPAFAQDDAALDALLDGSGNSADALALARKQAAEGDTLGAAATLERALMTHSKNNAEVRLYYATLLCQLGDRQTALTEISRTRGAKADSPAWAETRAACGEVALPSGDDTSIVAEASIGIAYDSDLARSLLIEYSLPGYPLVASDDGFSYTQSLRANLRTPQRGGLFFYGSGGGATRNPLQGNSESFLTSDLALGLGTQRGDTELSIGAILRHAEIGKHPFVTEIGGEAEVALIVPRGVGGRLSLRGEVVTQDFMGSTPAFSRDGTRFDIGLNYSGGDGPTRFWAGAAYENKSAETHRTGYSGGRIGASVRHGFGGSGIYTTVAGTLRYVEYNDEVGYPPVAETRFFSRAGLGFPLGIEGLGMEASGSYMSRRYNPSSTLRNYDNVGAELRLVWTFGN